MYIRKQVKFLKLQLSAEGILKVITTTYKCGINSKTKQMPIGQIIFITLSTIICCILYWKISTCQTDNCKLTTAAAFLFTSLIMIFIIVVLFDVNNSLKETVKTQSKQLLDKCPQYEKAEDVYRLKK